MEPTAQKNIWKECEICGKGFWGTKCSKVCGQACKVQANRLRVARKYAEQLEREAAHKPHAGLARDNAIARSLGLSYGQYKEKLRCDEEREARLAGRAERWQDILKNARKRRYI